MPTVIDIVRGKMTHVLAVQYHMADSRSIGYICQHWIKIIRYPHYLWIFYTSQYLLYFVTR